MNEERPIEKLLRRYAKKRRDEAGPARELHPANRRALQGEVARQFPKPPSKERSAFDGFIAALARRWIYAVSAFVVLMVAAVMLPTLSKSKSKTQLAKNEPESPAEAMTALAPAASVATPTSAAVDALAFAFETNSVASVAPAGLADNRREESARHRLGADRDFRAGGGNIAVVTDSTANIPTAPPTFEHSGAVSFGAKQETGTSLFLGGNSGTWNATVATTANTDLTVNTTKGSVANSLSLDKTWLARGGGLQEKDAEFSYRQNFANDQPLAKKVTAVSGEAKEITPVLANFQIEQSGNKLRVIDGDGSTYHGEVAPELAFGLVQNAAYKNDGKQKLASEQRVDQQQQADGVYQFRVAGTNRTLNQQVVFSWNCVPITNTLAFSNSSLATSEFKKFDAAKMPQQFPGFQNSIINGRAQIATEREIEINARPVAE